MKTIQEFESFYQNDLKNSLTALETDRKKCARFILATIFSFLLGGLATYLVFMALAHTAQGLMISVGAAILVLITFIVLLVSTIKKTNKYRHQFKETIIRKIVAFINPEMSYSPKGFLPRTTFQESGIYLNKINKYNGDDLISGKIDKTEVIFSEIHAQEMSGTGKDRKLKTIFRGIFFVADFHKDFSGKTFVLTDVAQRFLGAFGEMMQRNNMVRPELVKMENVTFEKEFVVYGTDQVEARYIITPVLMEKMLEIEKTFKNAQFSFVNSCVYIAIPLRQEMFEPKYFTSGLKTEYLMKYYSLIHNCVSLVETLELNKRIWSKE